jgi:outer membrane lipoprotein SlyB
MNWQNFGRHLSSLFFCALLLPSCVTKQTGLEVLSQPMTQDLEIKVLRQTKFTGAAIGVGVGALTGALVAGIDANLRGLNEEQTRRNIASGAVAGGAAGGYIGYRQGEKKGNEVVAKSLQRDQLRQLNKSAQAYNDNASQFNSALRRKMNQTKSISDPKEKKAMYKALLGQGDKKARDVNSRIAQRQNAIQNRNWNDNQKGTLNSELAELTRYRDQLNRTNEELTKAYNSTVPL